MKRTSVARDEIRQCKTLGLLGQIFRESMKMKAAGTPFLPLQLGDPAQFDFSPIPSFKEGIIKALEKPSSYAYGNPQGYPPLREKIAEDEGVSPDCVFVGNGVSDMMDKLFNVTAVQGTNALFPAPVFPPYLDLNRKNGIESRLYRCDPHTWQPLLASMEEAIDDATSMILINSPNNPTGAVYDQKTMAEIIDLAASVNRKRRRTDIAPLCLVFDEIYSEHFFGARPVDVKPLLKDKDITWIIFNGASKSLNVPGLRVGYALLGGAEQERLKEDLYNECILPLCMNSVFQEGYLAALTDPDRTAYYAANRNKLRTRRDLLLQGLDGITGIDIVQPQGAFYLIAGIETEYDNDLELGLALLAEAGICSSQMSSFFDQKTLPEQPALRLTILPPEEILEDAIHRFSRFMDSHGRN